MSGHEPEKQQVLLPYLRQELPALRQVLWQALPPARRHVLVQALPLHRSRTCHETDRAVSVDG